MFEQSLVLPTPDNKRWTFALSITLQLAAVTMLVLIPLIYTEQLSQVFTRARITAPAPPPPPPPAPTLIASSPQNSATVRVARMPTPVAFLRDRAPRPLSEFIDKVFAGDAAPAQVCTSCVSGGTGTGTGYLGDAARIAPAPVPPPPPPAVREVKTEASKLYRVGGDVMAAKMIRRVLPVYPVLARNARIAGTVRLEGIIARDGTISRLKVVSGHPLLVPAALEAVRQWVYRPTLLNGEPVEVGAPIEVTFTLSQ